MMDTPITPDQQDFDAIDKEYGPLPDNASNKDIAHRYRLAQAEKLMRIYGPPQSETPS